MLDSMDMSDPAIYQEDRWQEPFAQMRRDAPVHYCPESPYGPYWSITKYQDIMTVELAPEIYSSANELGGIQIMDQPTGGEAPNFIRMDPPKHTAQRKTVAPIVAPTNLRNFEETIRSRTAVILDNLTKHEKIDWVKEVSIPLTTMMLATLFDFPMEDSDKLTYWSDVAIANVDDPDAPVSSFEERMQVLGEMANYFAELWHDRAQRDPGFDLISMMAHSPATQNMPRPEFIGNIGLLIVGGNDTTRNSMTGGVMFLHENPEEKAKLKANPELISSLVPEVIRYQTPVIHMRRTAKTDTELNGQQIKAGDRVVMWYVSGNMDDAVIEDPTDFRIDRHKSRQHLSFGAGIHRCVGDRLAEQQLRILWEEILARDLDIEVVGAPQRIYSNFIRGIRSLDVIVR